MMNSDPPTFFLGAGVLLGQMQNKVSYMTWYNVKWGSL